MSVDRIRTHFEGNQRVDLPDFQSMMDAAFADFQFLIKTYIDQAAQRVVKKYKQGTHVGLTFKLQSDQIRAYHDNTQQWIYKSADTAGSTVNVTLTDNATQTVVANVNIFNDDLETRAFWDTDIGLTGEEFFDDINVRTRIEEAIAVRTGALLDGDIELFVVVTSGGAISSVTDAQDLLWEPRSFSLPAVGVRNTVYDSIVDLRSFIDFLAALWTEAKGTGEALENAPWSSFKLLREYQNIFYTGGGEVSWGVAAANTLRFTDAIYASIAGRPSTYQIGATGSNNDFVLAEGQCLYIDIPEGVPGGPLVPVIANLSAVPINPTAAGSVPRILVLFLVKNSQLVGSMDIPTLDVGETDIIGQDLPQPLRARLGLLTETTYRAYTSTNIIGVDDDYAEALSALDAAVESILTSTPTEEVQVYASPSNVFSATGPITWDADNAVVDILVFVNGFKQEQDQAGGSDGDFKKTSTNALVFTRTLPTDTKVSVFALPKGAGGGPGGGGGGGAGYLDINESSQVVANGFTLNTATSSLSVSSAADVVSDPATIIGAGPIGTVARMLFVDNIGSFTITLKAGGNVDLPNGFDMDLTPGSGATFKWNPNVNRWRCMGVATV